MSLASFFRELKSHANTDKTEFRDLRVLAFSYFLHSWRKSSLAAFSLPYVKNKDVHLSMDFLIDGRRIGCLEGPRITAGAWDPNYTPGVNFLTMIFFNLKNSG